MVLLKEGNFYTGIDYSLGPPIHNAFWRCKWVFTRCTMDHLYNWKYFSPKSFGPGPHTRHPGGSSVVGWVYLCLWVSSRYSWSAWLNEKTGREPGCTIPICTRFQIDWLIDWTRKCEFTKCETKRSVWMFAIRTAAGRALQSTTIFE